MAYETFVRRSVRIEEPALAVLPMDALPECSGVKALEKSGVKAVRSFGTRQLVE